MDGFEATTRNWPDHARDALARIAAIARTLVPDAEEGVSNGAKHMSLVPFSPPAIDAVRADLDGFTTSKGVIRFTADHPVPDGIVLRLVALRLVEIRGD